MGPLRAAAGPLRVSAVVSELVVGLALGASGLGILDAGEQTFAFMGEVGFGLVMFVAGSHVPMRDPALRAGLRRGAARAVAVGVLSVPAGFGLAWAFGTGHGPLYAVLLASSSATVIMPALGSAPLTAPAIVQMLAQVTIADLACIVALPRAIDPSHAPRTAAGAALVVVAAGALFVALYALERRGIRRRVHHVSKDQALAVDLRTSLALLFGPCALAVATGVSIMLAGFALGLAIAALGPPDGWPSSYSR